MGILDLPIELLRPIVKDVVLRHGRCGRYRGCCMQGFLYEWNNTDMLCLARVNTVFEWEVFMIWHEQRFLIDYRVSLCPVLLAHRDAPEIFARYISRLPRHYSSWCLHFPALINRIVDIIIQLDRPTGAVNIHAVRDHHIRALCHRANLRSLAYAETGRISRQPFRNHLLLSAICLQKKLIMEELTLLKFDLSDVESEYWSKPLNAAIRSGNAALVRIFIRQEPHFRNDKKNWSYVEDAVRSTNTLEILPMLLRQEGYHGTYETFHSFERAFKRAIKLDKEQVADMLLDTHRGLFGHGCFGYSLRSALVEACKRDMHRLVPRLIDAGGYLREGRWTGPKLCDLLFTAHEAGHESVVEVLVGKTEILRNRNLKHEYLANAAISGNVIMLQILLDAGATITAIPVMNVLAELAPRPQAVEAVLYLLDRVTIEELSRAEYCVGFSLADCMMAAAQQGNTKFLIALAYYGVPLEDYDGYGFYINADCPPPIVAAKAFKQAETVEALKEIGVSDMDPMQSIIARHFKSGRYPCDPPPFIVH
ncbi:hypothetical protein K458DRAFT_485967 [Lentithecium fluviatile CBS 122367]|uniref:Ankyrin n=1 Tax=Lentithecium fluviatile CBS 122367 TaxID=1168545 RepID=A0A6G1J8S4_9PLEO|nr:hypothetical protein K458DRAFT_485967 [Lentithecium fluviatile CBS 122367]